jgi:hypothetical protein
MKLLLDENLPVKLKFRFSKKHQVLTVREQNWSGKKNGELLGLMVLAGFEGLITIDKNLRHQQNLDKFAITIFVLNATDNKINTLVPFIEELEKHLIKLKRGVVEINVDQSSSA